MSAFNACSSTSPRNQLFSVFLSRSGLSLSIRVRFSILSVAGIYSGATSLSFLLIRGEFSGSIVFGVDGSSLASLTSDKSLGESKL